MKITMNGNPYDTQFNCLEDLLQEAGFAGKTVATGLNGSFVPVSVRAAVLLITGDDVEILAPMQGG